MRFSAATFLANKDVQIFYSLASLWAWISFLLCLQRTGLSKNHRNATIRYIQWYKSMQNANS